jgi:hypothetical protein
MSDYYIFSNAQGAGIILSVDINLHYPRFTYSEMGSNYKQITISENPFDLDAFYSISVTNDNANNSFYVYLNGVRIFEMLALPEIRIPSASVKMMLAANPASGGGFDASFKPLNANYYCYRIYNQPLTEEQILNN